MEYFFYSSIYLSYFFLLIAMVFGILKYKLLFTYEKWYVYYLLYTFLIEASNIISVKIFGAKTNAPIYPFYIGGIFSIMTFLFIKKLNLPKFWLLFIPMSGVLYLAVHFFLKDLNHDHVKVVSNIIIFGFAGVSLLQEIKKTNSHNRFLWIDAMIFLYYAVSAFIFILHNQLVNMSINNAYLIWGINNILTCVLYLSFTYTFLKLKK
ncbi:MAG: hypothetical protein K0R36_1799 [Chryseobacterium sp.]|nr:hypothetical protein [Chryseobacterium sp.]